MSPSQLVRTETLINGHGVTLFIYVKKLTVFTGNSHERDSGVEWRIEITGTGRHKQVSPLDDCKDTRKPIK